MRNTPTSINGILRPAFLAAAAIVALGALPQSARAQSDPGFSADTARHSGGKQVAQQVIAQLGLAVGLQSNVLKSQLQIIDALQGKVGVCLTGGNGHHHDDDDDDDHHHHGHGGHDTDQTTKHNDGQGGGDDDDHHGGTQGGGSFKLVSLKVGANAFLAVVEIYYDSACKKVFVHSPLEVRPISDASLALKETATFFKPNGTALGKLTLNGTGSKKANLLDLTGTGTFVPAGGGALVKFGVDCSYPAVLPGAKPFVCSGGVVASLNLLKMDFGLTSTVTTKVKETCGGFLGSFSGPVRLMTGAFGKLGVAVKGHSVSITGPADPLGTATISGSAQLTASGPSPVSWTVTDVDLNISVETYVSQGAKPGFSGIVRDSGTQKPLAKFAVDQSGNGSIAFSNNQKAGVTGWIVAN